MPSKNSVTMVSWNVNGMRSILKKNFYAFIAQYQPDILCLQETRMGSEEVAIDLPEHVHFWNGAVKLGYSGTAIFTRFPPLSVRKGIGIAKHDQEGRVLTLEFERFYLVDVYTPNAQPELKRLDYRAKSWEVDFLAYLKALETTKPVVCCGDLNVAHKPIDLARPKENIGSPGVTAPVLASVISVGESTTLSFRKSCVPTCSTPRSCRMFWAQTIVPLLQFLMRV